MRLPRMTTRRWMLAVAVVALLCLLEHRRRTFRSRAAYHQSRLSGLGVALSYDGHLRFYKHQDQGIKWLTNNEAKVPAWHEAMARKYRDGARYPWLPVEPDPPEPERSASGANGEP